MAKFPVWKYLLIIVAIIVGLIYSIPNFYGESPAVQISSLNERSTLNTNTLASINNLLGNNNITPLKETFDNKSLKIIFSDTDTQLKARDVIAQLLGENYSVALNLVSASPSWFDKIGADPMFLGLDLRGGVHFLLEVDTNAAIIKTLNKYVGDIKRDLRKNMIRFGNINIINNNAITIQFRDTDSMNLALKQIRLDLPQIEITNNNSNDQLVITINPEEIQKIKMAAVKQNILILHNRVNELGVTEPIIQQQGDDRIVVELPGIQDTARAKNILGRTATLEVRLVDDDQSDLNAALAGNVPDGYQLLDYANNTSGSKILVKKDVELTGDNITDAQPGFDENGAPSVNIRFDSIGSDIFKQITGENIGKRLAMVLIDNGKGQVVTAPTINVQIGGGNAQISGAMNVAEANDIALLLRSGSLAAPMNIIVERTVGPSLGQENIVKGFHSLLWGFVAIALFMMIYYLVFGVISVISLAVNLLLLVALLSMLQATLTLPGIAAIALALGMAIDSNVLINERIREELRANVKPHNAIESGYRHAFATIIDSNVTTLIAGLALLAFGTGPIKGFAIVHCLGILTSIFSAVLVSRGIVGLLFTKRKIKKLYI